MKKKKRKFRRKYVPYILAAEGILIAALLFIGVRLIVPAMFNRDTIQTEETSAADQTPSENASDKAEATDEAPAKNEPTTITVSFAGDCTLGTDEAFDYSTSLNAYYESNGPDYFFQNVRSIFEADDLSIVNLEGPLTTSNERNENQFAFKGDPEYTSILTSGSVEAVNMANNHSHDYGEQGYEDTLQSLRDAGITSFGYDETAVIEVKGIKIGLVGIYELYDHLERTQQLKDNIAKVKEEGAQIIIVEFHWGNERETSPDSNQITLGHLAIDEGATVVIGHHSHVIQPIEKYNGRYIAYSMANFCFGGNSAPSDMDTFIFQQTFTVDENGQVAQDDNYEIIPCSVSSEDYYNNYQPTPATGDESQRIYNRVMAGVTDS